MKEPSDSYLSDYEAQHRVFERMFPLRDEFLLLFSRVLGVALRSLPSRELPRIDALFEIGVPAIHHGIQRLIPDYWKVGVTGSFVHGGRGRYQAAFDGGYCEIGDLLVVAQLRRGANRRAP